jgi:uncharacterized protein (DUF58 family)
MVREFEEERTRRLLIVIDTERDATPADTIPADTIPAEAIPAEAIPADAEPRFGVSGQVPTPLDRCCTAAASLATAALARGHGARLAAATPGGLDVIGRADDHEILRWLAELAPSGVSVADASAELPLDATRGVESVVIVAPVWRAAWSSLVTAVGTLGGVVPRVACVLVGTAEGSDRVTPDALPDEALHEAGASLVAAGAEVYPWPSGADLATVLGGPG